MPYNEKEILKIIERTNSKVLKNSNILEQQLKKEQLKKVENLPHIGKKDLVIRSQIFKCMHNQHHVIDLDSVITIIDHDDKEQQVEISAGYCEECNIYFILESTYENLKKKGIILCRISDEKTYMENSYGNGMKLAQESILRQYGYTVSQQEGLSATRRQKILAVMIDHHILSKNEIISYLDFFINQRKYQIKFQMAVAKWEMDREFVEMYRVGEYKKFGVNAIYRR